MCRTRIESARNGSEMEQRLRVVLTNCAYRINGETTEYLGTCDKCTLCRPIAILCETQRNYFVKSRRPQTPNLRGCIVRRRRGTTPDRSTHHVRKPSDRLVRQAARSALAVNHGGRIHCGLRGSQRRCLGPTIPDGIRNHDDPQPVHRQRGSLRIEPDLQLRLAESTQRAVIPISASRTDQAS